MKKITLVMLTTRAADEVIATDKANAVIESGASGTADMLRDYLLGHGLNMDEARSSKIFEDAAEAMRAAYRSQYCNRVRKIGGETVNMELARVVMDAPESVRDGWAKDSTEKKIWAAVLAFGRTKLQRVCDILWPKTANEEGGKADKTKKAPTPDTILANLDAFLASNPAPALVALLFDQIGQRRPAK